MLEVSRRIRLVAPRTTPVLIEGPTGSGKELVAEAVHRLSNRCRKPFVALNCAAIPETLLEAELFGHTRGAFTGAVQGRVGRIEAANGGTLFLDEIGEMPLALQSKLLRFVECGELQRVGDNETVKVDVRIVTATHQPLAQHTQDGKFRADLYYRLAVFLIRTPALSEHLEDLNLLVEHFLEKMGRDTPVKQIDMTAQAKLAAHAWPGNVRELQHDTQHRRRRDGRRFGGRARPRSRRVSRRFSWRKGPRAIGGIGIDFGRVAPHDPLANSSRRKISRLRRVCSECCRRSLPVMT